MSTFWNIIRCLTRMAEARRLKAGRWRIYLGSDRSPLRDPASGGIATFESLAEARRWWHALHPQAPALQEATKCAWCGAYFGETVMPVSFGGRWYHAAHTPPTIANGRRFSLGEG